LAWLGTAPKPLSSSKGRRDTDTEPLTRMQRMAVDDLTPDMPPIRTPWIIDHLMDLGPSEAGAMGPVPISWASIDHWQRCSGHDLPPWTTRLLRRLSVDFVAETVRAREPDCPPPWTATSSFSRDEVSRKVTNAFRALMISKEPNP
jgi:hypothetical protein